MNGFETVNMCALIVNVRCALNLWEKEKLISVSEINLGRKTKYQLDKVHDTHF